MKKIVLMLSVFLITLMAVSAQELLSYKVYAEFYDDSTKQAYLSDSYDLMLYDNAMGLENLTDSIPVAHNGFIAKLVFIHFNDSLRRLYYNAFDFNETGILRIRMWDTKLYGYCYVREIDWNMDRTILTLIGRKNVPQRIKLLFKDSPSLRMWNYPWLGE